MKRWMALLMAVCMLFALVGCTAAQEPQEEPIWEPEVPEVIDLPALLTHDDVSAAISTVTFGEGMLQEHDTVWLFSTEDYTTQISLMAELPTISTAEYITLLRERYPEGSLVEANQLGNAAFWCGDSGELIVDQGKYVFCLSVCCTTLDSESRLIIARGLAVKVLDRLQSM